MSEENKDEVSEEVKEIAEGVKLAKEAFKWKNFLTTSFVGVLLCLKTQKIPFFDHKPDNEQSTNRGPASEDFAPWRLNLRLAELSQDLQSTKSSHASEISQLRSTFDRDREANHEDKSNLEGRVARIESKQDQMNEKLDQVLIIMKTQRTYSGLIDLNPNKKAN